MNNYIDITYKTANNSGYPNYLCGYLKKRFNLSGNLLDIGCGTGVFSNTFSEMGLDVFCIDRSVSKNQNHLKIKYLDFSKTAFPFESNFFDTLFVKSVLEHIFDPEFFINECKRVLKPNGRIIFLTPEWYSQKSFFYDDPTHIHPYTVKSCKDFLEMYNFKETISEEFYQLPIIWKHPNLKIICKILQSIVTADPEIKNKFIRWSVELMVLSSGIKNES